MRAQSQPIAFRCGAAGALRARIGPIHARVAVVPIRLAVPFLGRLQTVGAVGPFDLGLEPVDVALEELELRCEGVLGGDDGLTSGSRAASRCELNVDVEGTLPGRVRARPSRVRQPREGEEEAL